MATFDWIGEGFNYGKKINFFSITTEDVQLIFCIYKTTTFSDEPFVIERATKNINSINIQNEIEEEIKNIYIVKTDDFFRKKFKRSYYLLKFETESRIITVGAYTDNRMAITPDNMYLVCEGSYINILAETEVVESAEQLDGTAFGPLKAIFNKKELAKELLKHN